MSDIYNRSIFIEIDRIIASMHIGVSVRLDIDRRHMCDRCKNPGKVTVPAKLCQKCWEAWWESNAGKCYMAAYRAKMADEVLVKYLQMWCKNEMD